MSASTSDPSAGRRPYHGSCSCGHTNYLVFLILPPTMDLTANSIHIKKCNCTICHKMGFFHLRLISSPDDFILLSPLDPETGGLGDYTLSGGKTHRYFCKTCGVLCFSFRGTGEVVEAAVEDWGNNEEGITMRFWRPKKEGWMEGKGSYLSVNAVTLEQGQEGLDMKEWTEKKWIWYVDAKHRNVEPRIGEPFEGGCY